MCMRNKVQVAIRYLINARGRFTELIKHLPLAWGKEKLREDFPEC